MSENFGEYTLLKLIATGGMAEIYLSQHRGESDPNKRLVVKKMLPQLAVRKDFVSMFLDEARLAANLVHPNIVQVFNMGEVDQSYFMAMELIDGPHLGALFAHSLRIRRPLPIDLCVHAISESSKGLHFAHLCKGRSGQPLEIVHRDISPQNILVSRFGDVKVTDFGVAKAANQSRKTRTGIIKGKVSYMSPEQCLGDEVNPQTDVFALGIVLYELLTRRRLFREKSDLLVMQRITTEKIKPPSEINPGVNEALDAITMRALERDLSKRFQNAKAFSDALVDWLQKNGHSEGKSRLAQWMKTHGETLRASPASDEAISSPIAQTLPREKAALVDGDQTQIRREDSISESGINTETGDAVDQVKTSEGVGTQVFTTKSLERTAKDQTVLEGQVKMPSATALALPPASGSPPNVDAPIDGHSAKSPAEQPHVPLQQAWSPSPASDEVALPKSNKGLSTALMLMPLLLLGVLLGAWWMLRNTENPRIGDAQVLQSSDAGEKKSAPLEVKKPDAGPQNAQPNMPIATTKNNAAKENVPTPPGMTLVEVTSVPSNVEVKVGPNPAKRTPFTIPLKTGSNFFVTAFFPGQPPFTKTHKDLSETHKVLELKARSVLEVISDPPGASVRVDGKNQGKTPLRALLISPDEEHDIIISRSGFISLRKQVLGSPGETLRLEETLKVKSEAKKPAKKSEYGKINVFSFPTGKIVVDGVKKGNSPKLGIPLKVGKHRITISNNDPKVTFSQTTSIEVKKDETHTLKLLLKKEGDKWVFDKWRK